MTASSNPSKNSPYHRFIPREEVQEVSVWEFQSMDGKPTKSQQAAQAEAQRQADLPPTPELPPPPDIEQPPPYVPPPEVAIDLAIDTGPTTAISNATSERPVAAPPPPPIRR